MALGKEKLDYLSAANQKNALAYMEFLYRQQQESENSAACANMGISRITTAIRFSFETMFESGRYVICAVGTINTVEKVRNCVDLFAFRFTCAQKREAAIRIKQPFLFFSV